jgi:hypothetical protein
LGQGTQAETLRADDTLLGRKVAIKRFKVGHARSWKDVELAEREARILSSLSHPALPQYFDYFEESGCLYLVMECIEGQSLSTYVRQGNRLSLAELRRLLDTLSEVLEYLHSRVPPVIHRDIKPGNIIRRPDGSFCLVDFGSVRDGLRPEGGSTVVGTFGFMAPEQFQGRAMPATDVYAVGALLLSLLTGKSPEELPHEGLAIDARSALGTACPAPWVDIIVQMVNINPDQRPSSLVPLVKTLDQQRSKTQASSTPSGSAAASNAQRPDATEARDPDAAFTVMVGSGFGLIPFVAVTLARIAIWFALGVVVPLVLYILAIFFGPRLRAAAAQVAQAGLQARARLRDVAGHLQRAEPFLLQGRHYRKRGRRYRAYGPEQHDWRHWMRDWQNYDTDWRSHSRDDSSEFDEHRQSHESRQSRANRSRHNRR